MTGTTVSGQSVSIFGLGTFRKRNSDANLSQVRKVRSHRHALRILDVVTTTHGLFVFTFCRHADTLLHTNRRTASFPVHLHFSFFSRDVTGPK
jgi:hypothetical protein